MIARNVYLAGVVQSRGLYRELLQEALGILPIAPAAELAALESFAALGTIAKKLNVSRKTIAGDMRRLENYGWVTSGETRELGHRDVTGVYLLADLAAQSKTGVVKLVSSVVVYDILAKKADVKTTDSKTGTGLARRWTP